MAQEIRAADGVAAADVADPESAELAGTGGSAPRGCVTCSPSQGGRAGDHLIDELDGIGRSRSGAVSVGGGNDEREQTLDQILTEMDGFESSEAVVVLGATNRPEILDSALLRPGRFDRRVAVQAPDRTGRRQILEVHTRSMPLAADVDLDALAATTPGMVGADLVGMLTPDADPVRKVSIIPRGMALALTLSGPDADRVSYSLEDLEAKIRVALGGRAAEEVVYGKITTGAESDLQQLTQIARQMVGRWGMSEAVVPITVLPSEAAGPLLPGASETWDETQRLVDREVRPPGRRGPRSST